MNAKKLAAVTCMDDFHALIAVADTKDKLLLGDKIFNFISNEANSIECEDIGLFIDSLVPWCHSSNFKVTLIGIDILTALADRMKSDFRSYVSIILSAMIERLGDSKEAVRKKAQNLLTTLMSIGAMSPAYLFEKLSTTGFTHKNSYIREESLKCLLTAIEVHGTKSLGVTKLLPLIIKLLSDSSATVRETAMKSLVELYKHIGEPFKYSLLKNQTIPPNKLQHILETFEKVAGCVKECDENFAEHFETDEVDRSANKVAVKRINSVYSSASQPSSLRQTRIASGASLKKNGDTLPRTGGAAGAVDEECFLKAFEDVPKIQIFSAKNVCEHITKIKEILENTSIEWDKRVDALKRFRSLLVAGATNYEEFYQNLRYLELPFQTSCKDLRSQVVRESCISISFLSVCITSKAEHFCESLFTVLINLIQNSAKVTATSGLVCLRLLLKNTHSPRFIPIITHSLQSKSREIRRACCEFLDLIIHSWVPHTLEKHVTLLQDALKRGITDPDSDTRALARKAYHGFSEIFPDQAEALYNSLGNVYKKAVSGDASNFGSTNSLNQPTLTQPSIKPIKYTETASQIQQTYSNRRKSNSAIDLQAAQRAKARAHYAALARQKVGSGVSSLQRSPKISTPEPVERTSRTKSRMSVSQPSSRSSSPSSKLNSFIYSPSSRARRGSSGIPRSTDTSREPSPNRFSSKHFRGRPPIQSPARPVMAQKMLQQSREVESALADALGSTPDTHNPLLISPRRTYRSFDERSDDSETSSICSERSFDISRKSSDPFSWNHHSAHGRFSNCDPEELKSSIGDIIMNCESVDWGDRKDGLVSLQRFFQAGNKLSPGDLKHVCDVFTKMFSDSYTKVFSLFLDTLNELIIAHAADLHSWLYLLLTRLFNKSGTDLLNSIQTKILKTLKVVREVFPANVQLHSVFRYLVDPTQTPNPRAKLAVLNFITSLAAKSNPSQAFVTPDNQKDYSLPALKKMVGWIMGDNIKNGPELKRAAQEAVLALFNLNAPQVTLRFSQFPQEYQEAASNLIKMRLRRSNSGSGNGSYSPHNDSYNSPASSQLDENINPEEVYQTLVRTTAEIQKYSVESGLSGEAESHDSGISQLSQHDKSDLQQYPEGTSPVDTADSSFDSSEKDEQSSLCKALDDMSLTEDNSMAVDSKTEISKLNDLVCHSAGPVLEKNFKGILRRVIQLLADQDPKIREASILLLYSMIKNNAITHCFVNYVELLILKLFETIQDSSRVASRVAELCALAASSILPIKQVLRTVVPLITAEDFPVNALAIKMLTQVTQPENAPLLQDYITVIMPGLLQCYENQDSSVRKSAVFCMVALHKVLGEDVLTPYLNTLNGAKLKLLHLYIKRSSMNQSPTSPKTN